MPFCLFRLAKYISKNIDGHGFATNKRAEAAIDRVAAWASTWRIRHFQILGLAQPESGANCGTWRPQRIPIKIARAAADDGDWATYEYACGDMATISDPLRILKLWDDRPGRYG